ncbi:MAG: hypothetical protein ACRDPA_33735 [Solirubrobacteraceae bacterium]
MREATSSQGCSRCVKWLTAAAVTLRDNCVRGITANRQRLADQTAAFVGVITAFTPYIGYGAAAEVVSRALATGESVTALIVETGLMEAADVQILLAPARLAGEDLSAPALSRAYGYDAAAREHEIRE